MKSISMTSGVTPWLLLTSCLTVLASAILVPALPAMSDFYQAHEDAEFWSKLVVSMPGLSIALVAPLVGRIIDRVEVKPWLLTAILFFAMLGISGWVVSHSLWWLLATRFVLGIAVAVIMVSVSVIAGRLYSGPLLGTYMGWQAALGSVAGVVFLMVGGVIAELHWQSPFLLYALALILIPGLLVKLNQATLEPPSSVESAHSSTSQLPKSAVLGCSALAFVELIFLNLIPLQFPFHVQSLASLSLTATGFWLALIFTVVAVVSFFYDKIQRRVSYFGIHIWGYLAIAMGLQLAASTNNLYGVIAGYLVMAVGFGLIRPNLIMWLFSLVPPAQRGQAMGWLTSSFFVAQFLSPVLFQPVLQLLGISGMLWVASVLAILVALILGVSGHQQKTKITGKDVKA